MNRLKRLKGRDIFGRFVSGDEHPMKTIELREKSSKSHKGQKSWNKGKKGLYFHSEETRKKMSNSHIGKNTWSKGRIPWNKGIPHTEEQKLKLKIARRHRVIPKKDSKPERMLALALTLNRIPFEKHKPILGQPDIFIEPNICIFVDGDFWHANPEKYDSETYIIHGRLAKDIWARDSYVNHALNELGYQVIRIWESKIKYDVDICAKNIIKLIQSLRSEMI